MLPYVILAVLGYLLGNVQFAIILSKLRYKDDIRKHGSGNAGATNMVRVYGLKPGLLTFVGDFSKGVIAVVLGRLLAGETGAYVCALFTVLGHDFPAFLKFKGGKGVASTFGVIWALSPLYGAIITVLCGGILLLTRTVSIASLSGSLTFVLLCLLLQWENTAIVLLAVCFFVLIVVRHMENIKRLIKGQESKLFGKRNKKDDVKGE